MEKKAPSPFLVKDCTLAAMAIGQTAQTLNELSDRIIQVPASSIYYHFWGNRLGAAYEYREHHNDFAYWAHKYLADDVLAERLDLIDPTEYADMEGVKEALKELIENHLAEFEYIPWVRKENRFHFLSSKIVVFSTRHQINSPQEAAAILPKLSLSSFFYHVIDAVRRVPDKRDDFSKWLSEYGNHYEDLIQKIRHIDPYFVSLPDLKKKFIETFEEYFIR